MKERRKDKRWFLSTYLEAYREGRTDSPGYLADISLGGLLLMGRYPVQTNIVMPLKIKLEKEVSVNEEIRVVTQVVRCGKQENDSYYKTGCKLIDLSNSSREIIERMIELYSIN